MKFYILKKLINAGLILKKQTFLLLLNMQNILEKKSLKLTFNLTGQILTPRNVFVTVICCNADIQDSLLPNLFGD